MLAKLRRIAAAACLLATAFFVILRMRSLKQSDVVLYFGNSLERFEANSNYGSFELLISIANVPMKPADIGFHYGTGEGYATASAPAIGRPRFYFASNCIAMFTPHWSLVLLFGGMAATMLLRWPLRFSLKTLAITATLMAITLGLGVAASRLSL